MQGLEKVAVIDVGSNSCRMVIYEQAGAALLPYFNEKAMAGLGRGSAQTGLLSVEGKAKALETFRRFRAILSGLGIERVQAVATAAVREATDGPQFQTMAEAALGVELRILSGAEEGMYSALGVASGFRGATGLVGDLGGSSLELKLIGNGALAIPGESYLLGPLARAEDQALDISKRRKVIRKILADSELLKYHSERLFVVGGAWRNVAAVHMALTKYPLGVIHGYELNRRGVGLVVEAVQGARSHKALQARLQRISKRRFDTLFHAALVLEGLLDIMDSDAAFVSAYGLREGVLAGESGHSPDQRLFDTTQLYLRLTDASAEFGRRLHEFVKPVLSGLDQPPELVQVTCLMADAGARLHPDHRPALVFQQVLRAPIPSLLHEDRLFSAYAVATRYASGFVAPSGLDHLMSPQLRAAARLVGTAMRLGGVYSGRSASILETARLVVDSGDLALRVLSANRDMVSDAVTRRLQDLARQMKLNAKVELVDRF